MDSPLISPEGTVKFIEGRQLFKHDIGEQCSYDIGWIGRASRDIDDVFSVECLRDSHSSCRVGCSCYDTAIQCATPHCQHKSGILCALFEKFYACLAFGADTKVFPLHSEWYSTLDDEDVLSLLCGYDIFEYRLALITAGTHQEFVIIQRDIVKDQCLYRWVGGFDKGFGVSAAITQLQPDNRNFVQRTDSTLYNLFKVWMELHVCRHHRYPAVDL